MSSPEVTLTCGTTTVEEETALTYEEENAVRYVGGYVIRELMKDKSNSHMLPLLKELIDSEERPEHWVTAVNRGGLTKITDEAYRCFYDIEVHTRRFFKISNTRDMNEQFTKKVLESVLNDDNLLFGWCFAAGLIIDQDVANSCLEKIAKKWYSIRGNSFAKKLME